jgi:hypothetical protein
LADMVRDTERARTVFMRAERAGLAFAVRAMAASCPAPLAAKPIVERFVPAWGGLFHEVWQCTTLHTTMARKHAACLDHGKAAILFKAIRMAFPCRHQLWRKRGRWWRHGCWGRWLRK